MKRAYGGSIGINANARVIGKEYIFAVHIDQPPTTTLMNKNICEYINDMREKVVNVEVSLLHISKINRKKSIK